MSRVDKRMEKIRELRRLIALAAKDAVELGCGCVADNRLGKRTWKCSIHKYRI